MYIVDLVFTIGLTLGVGSSTFALLFFIMALQDGTIDASERRFLHAVFVVLRIGMTLIFLGLLGKTLGGDMYTAIGLSWGLLGVITLNAVLMTKKLMPMRFGPVLAGGSWYSLFIVSNTGIAAYGIGTSLIAYAVFLGIFFTTFEILKSVFIPKKGAFRGEVRTDEKTLTQYATDASVFRRMPQAVYYPKDVSDVQALVGRVREERKKGNIVSLTPRAGGTCMSGGPLTQSWVVDMTKYMNKVSIDPKTQTATVEAGAYFRDIEDAAAKHRLMFAAYPSSHRLCGIGGMIGNNASGEKSLRGGATVDNVIELEVVCADQSVRRIASKPLTAATNPDERAIISLFDSYGAALRKATGEVKKAASGYRLERVVQNGVFSAVPLFVGAQGTLGVVTKAVLKLVPIPAHTELIIISAQSLKDVSKIVETVYTYNPEGLETFDRNTYEKARTHLAVHAEALLPLIDPEGHLFILAQFSEETEEATKRQAAACLAALTEQGYFVRRAHSKEIVDAAWQVRRNSFTLMRDHNEPGYRAVPCIEDVIVPVSALGTFIAGLDKILKKRRIAYGFHGHIGDGSLRIIPVFNFGSPSLEKDIAGLMEEVFVLVKKVKGNISADHSDGIIRTPYLREFYGEKLYTVFEDIKKLYDPENLMNPHKKVGGTIELLNESLHRG